MFGRVRDAMFQLKVVFNPEHKISDFESGLMESVKLQLPNVQHHGCHFHFGQSIWQKILELGLTTSYREKD